MPVLTLGYRHCDRKRPSYIKNSEIEGIAVLARQQLVEAAADAIPLWQSLASVLIWPFAALALAAAAFRKVTP